MKALAILLICAASSTAFAQQPRQPDWKALEPEVLKHFQALVQINTTDPPGGEKPAADYVKQVLEGEGIPVVVYSMPNQPNRPNVIARLKGSGKKRPLLIVGHLDTVNIDEKKWTFPPFSAARDGGFIYGRGTVDDKDNLTSSLMIMLMLKRLNVPLDRDVILLAEAGEEGNSSLGVQFIANQHLPEIESEYCLAEGGGVVRENGAVKFAQVQTLEKIPRAIELTARGPSGHASVPLKDSAVVHLTTAVTKAAQWKVPLRLNETTRVYFQRLAAISSAEAAARYRDVLSNDPAKSGPAADWLFEHEPRHASMIRTSISPTMINAGYRINVIPSEVKATLDVRTAPGENPQEFLNALRAVIDDPAVDVSYAARDVRPDTASARLDNDIFKALEAAVRTHYDAVILPTMSTGATDMAYLRAKGIECYGIGPATDIEDSTKGFAAHGDQERILESELYRFVRFNYDVVAAVAAAR
jgi:acetylornithine deacetylase/succinyl-diaminopimelate desuccinylase-like protein